MKIQEYKSRILPFLVLMMLFAFFVACSGRHEPASVLQDGSRIFALDNEVEIIDQIQFYKFISPKSKIPLGFDTIFTLEDKNYLRVLISLKDSFAHKSNPAMFHLDWIDPDQQSFFMKRSDLLPDSLEPVLESSVSLSPEKRVPGKHLLRIYYFRELIAEKVFTLLSAGTINYKLADLLLPEITLCESKSRKGDYRGVDSVFVIGDKERVRAYVDVDKLNTLQDPLFIFELSWTGPDGESFYTKNFEVAASDEPVSLYSSISIPPDKREPGSYALRFYLFDELIATKSFILK